MESVALVVFFVLLGSWVAFWVIRLGVRYGVDDALRHNAGWLRRDDTHDTAQH